MALNSLEDVANFEKEFGYEELIASAMGATKRFNDDSKRWAWTFIEQRRAAERSEMERRQTEASEKSATATADAASAARTSARAASVAIWISLAALAVAAWPYMPWSR